MPWVDPDQVEQDLVLSRLILETANLDAKLTDPRFTTDLDALVAAWPEAYSTDAAASLAADIIHRD